MGRGSVIRLGVTLAALAVLGGLWRADAQPRAAATPDPFGHQKHAKLFPLCQTCHAAAERPGAAYWPAPASCAECHDGVVEERVDWTPPTGPPVTNLRFEHGDHAGAVRRAADPARRQPVTCVQCHAEPEAGWMEVGRAVVLQCLDCHRSPPEHLANPDTACAACHLPLAQAVTLTDARIEAFEKPPDHTRDGFMARGPAGHGTLARPTGAAPGAFAVAASCATCHAREFCITCHVNAPETPSIQALGLDRRSLLHEARLVEPATHAAGDFQRKHGRQLGRDAVACATCHTRESCTTCHVAGPPRGAVHLAQAGPGRGAGAELERARPATHQPGFAERHASLASATTSSCYGCHARTECLDCHRPSPGSGGGFHPAGFLASHPAQAYTRGSSCADCHNQAQFCASCHAQAGLAGGRRLGQGPRYHDAKQGFSFGHGQAARQSLETCVSCHVERDCLPCHSAALGGFGFSPHGPGFDPARLRRKNPEMCTVCHGVAIPGGA